LFFVANPRPWCQVISPEAVSVCDRHFKAPIPASGYGRNTTIGNQLYPRCFRRSHEAINNRLGRVGHWKHAAITLGFEFNTASLKPCDGIAGLKAMEWRDQRLVTPWKPRSQFPDIETGMSHVTAAPSGNPDLRQELRPLFQQDHLRARRRLRASYRRKKTCGPATHHNNLSRTHA
jgi:hypothetical protein